MIIPSFRPLIGGAERQLEGLAAHLADGGADIVVFTRRVSGTKRAEDVDGYKIERLFSRIPKIGFALSLFFTLLVRNREFDVLHCHTLNGQSALVSVAVGFLTGRPVVLKVTRSGHGTQLENYLRTKIGRIYFYLLSRGARKMVAITEDVKTELLRANVKKEKIVEIPNGVGLPETILAASDKTVTITFVGRLIDRKRADILIRAFAIVRKKRAVSLQIVGQGPEEDALRKLVETLELDDCINFLGELTKPQVAQTLNKTDIFVLPSESEGMSNSLLEAMAFGLPVIATDIKANRELVENRTNGLLFQSDEDLGKALLLLSSNATLRNSLGAQARSLIEKRFSFDVVSRSYLELYKKLSHAL